MSNSTWSPAITWSRQPSTWGQKEARKMPGGRERRSYHTPAKAGEPCSRPCSPQLTWLQPPSVHRHLHQERRMHWLIKMDHNDVSTRTRYESSQGHLVLGGKKYIPQAAELWIIRITGYFEVKNQNNLGIYPREVKIHIHTKPSLERLGQLYLWSQTLETNQITLSCRMDQPTVGQP